MLQTLTGAPGQPAAPAQPAQPLQPVQPVAQIGGTSIKLAKPDKFDGSKKDKSVDFQISCTHYLQAAYPNPSVDNQILFMISYLEGSAHDWLKPYLEQDLDPTNPVIWLHNAALFWTEFDCRFGEVNKVDNYCGKLCKLSQTKSAQDYLREFQTLSARLRYDTVVL
jgi:hypothetical protein